LPKIALTAANHPLVMVSKNHQRRRVKEVCQAKSQVGNMVIQEKLLSKSKTPIMLSRTVRQHVKVVVAKNARDPGRRRAKLLFSDGRCLPQQFKIGGRFDFTLQVLTVNDPFFKVGCAFSRACDKTLSIELFERVCRNCGVHSQEYSGKKDHCQQPKRAMQRASRNASYEY